MVYVDGSQIGGREKILGLSRIVHEKKNYYKMKYFRRDRAKPLTVTDFWPCKLIIYWFYCTGVDMRGSDAGRQYCFLAGLKSVVDKNGGEKWATSGN